MNPSTRILYPHAWFAAKGLIEATPGAGTVGADYKPAPVAADSAGDDIFLSLGRLAGIQDTPTIGNRIEIWTGSPGKKVLANEIATMPKQEITASCQELTLLAIQACYSTLSLGIDLTATAQQFNPLEGLPIIEGWLKIQYYDHNDVLVANVDRWGGLNFEGSLPADGENMEYSLKHTVYHSQYNTGVLLPA